jgi:hypothetical protein
VRRAWVLLTAGVVVAAAVVAAVVLSRGGSDDEDPAPEARAPRGAEAIACAALLADVKVLGAVERSEDTVLLTVRVTSYLRPPGGPQKVQVTVTDPRLDDHGLEPWAEGTEGLLLVPSSPRLASSFFTGADHSSELASYQALLPEAQELSCPAEYSQPSH